MKSQSHTGSLLESSCSVTVTILGISRSYSRSNLLLSSNIASYSSTFFFFLIFFWITNLVPSCPTITNTTRKQSWVSMIRCTVLQSSSNSMNSHRQAFMNMKRYTVWCLPSRLLPSDSKKHVHDDRPNFDPRPCFTHALNIPTCSWYWIILTPEPARFRSAVTNCFYKP